MSTISEKIIENIHEKKITPRPRWYFLIRNYGTFLLFIFSIIFGAISVSTILFMLSDYDRDIFQYFNRSFTKDIIVSVPYFWIIVFALFAISAYYNFRRISTAYRFELHKVVLLNLFLTVAIGTGLFYAGLHSAIDEFFSRRLPLYEKLIYDKDDIWIFPDRGLLSGDVVEILGTESFLMRDANDQIWQITEDTLDPSDFTHVREGRRIKIIGQQLNENTFSAKIIRPWESLRPE